MFGFTENDVLNCWLEAAREGRTMFIDSPQVRQMIKKEIECVRKNADARIQELERLLSDERYFSNPDKE